jgi:hypothetical protein
MFQKPALLFGVPKDSDAYQISRIMFSMLNAADTT